MTLFALFPGMESVVAATAAHMRENNLTPADVLAAYDAWMAERMRGMEPVKRGASDGLRVASSATRNQQRHKAGDHAQLPRACPKCGAAVELLQLCHISSPVWRTQLACMADACDWHGKSRLPIDALLAAGAKNIKHNVIEG